MKGFTFFAKNSGMEVKAETLASNNGKKEGGITLRFFTFGADNETLQMRFKTGLNEAFAMALAVTQIARNLEASKQIFTHKFNGEQGEVITKVTLEKWVRNDKSGFAISIKRDDKGINVPLNLADFLYCAELMKHFSLVQAWSAQGSSQEQTASNDAPANDASDDEDPMPTEKNAPGSSSGNNATATSADAPRSNGSNTGEIVEIEAVRKDGKGFKASGKWYKITDRSVVEVELEKGVPVLIEARESNGILFANKVSIAA